MTYIHELTDWPHFYWDTPKLAPKLIELRLRQGQLMGQMQALGFPLRTEAVLQTLTMDVLKSSEIEGEILNVDQVRSSIARRLGVEIAGAIPSDRNVDGVVEMMLDATQNFDRPLTADRLYNWHKYLFPTAAPKILVGQWRNDQNGPMQVISGPAGHEYVHFLAPDASRLDAEMQIFLNWMKQPPDIDPVLRAALAHLWFVTIHPFEDGNGRIARALADGALAKSENSPQRFYSMSAQIRHERKDYYEILEHTQKGTMDISDWMDWFLNCLDRAMIRTQTTLTTILQKAEFWREHAQRPFNDRQRLMINKLLDGFDGHLTSSKWALMTKCSQDTATRDLQSLKDMGILIQNPGGGRSTSYRLK